MDTHSNVMPELSDEMPQGFAVGLEPSRLTWDSKRGYFTTEFGEVLELPFDCKVMGGVYVYSKWSGQIGRPLCQSVGECCGMHEGCSQGMRIGLMLIDPITLMEEPYFIDLYGLARKSGSRIVSLVANHGPMLKCSRTHTIKTNNGDIIIPVFDLPDEFSLGGPSDNGEKKTYNANEDFSNAAPIV